MPRFKVRQESNGFWRFQLLTATGAVLLEGNPYPFKESCKEAILSIKQNQASRLFFLLCFFLLCYFLSPTLKGGKKRCFEIELY
jgi:uncharacterized protein YegP (UPF0339 family)